MEINEYAKKLGFSSSGQSYRVLVVDNGSDLQGTGATGDFVEKSFENNEVQKTSFAKEFTGTVVANRAQVTAKGREKSWMTSEFDPMGKDLIPVMGLKEGRIMKNNEGQTLAKWMTYKQLKDTKSTTNPDGSMDRSYVYLTILYVLMEGTDEVVKIKVKGGGRGNYIDYSKSLQKKGLEPYNVITKFYSAVDPNSNGKFSVFFQPMMENNQVKLVQEQSRLIEAMKIIIEDQESRRKNLTSPQSNLQVSQEAPQEDIPVIEEPQEEGNFEIKEGEIPFS